VTDPGVQAYGFAADFVVTLAVTPQALRTDPGDVNAKVCGLVLLVFVAVRHLGDVRRASETSSRNAAGLDPRLRPALSRAR
jgi:hypothetical protein